MPHKLILYTDGRCRHNPGPAAIGVVILDENNAKLSSISAKIGPATNNQAEYRAVIAGLEKALILGAREVEIRTDSMLVVGQISGRFKVNDVGLKSLSEKAGLLREKFEVFRISHITRGEKFEADHLACQALKENTDGNPKSDFNIRRANIKDMDGMNRVWAEVEEQHAAALPNIFRRVINPTRDRGYVAAIMADRNSAMFVAELKNTVIGLIQVMLQASPDVPYMGPRRFAKVSDLVVVKEYQNKGAGRLLMKEAETWAISKRANSVELNVYEFNTGARNFYQSLGYTTGSRMMWKLLDEIKQP